MVSASDSRKLFRRSCARLSRRTPVHRRETLRDFLGNLVQETTRRRARGKRIAARRAPPRARGRVQPRADAGQVQVRLVYVAPQVGERRGWVEAGRILELEAPEDERPERGLGVARGRGRRRHAERDGERGTRRVVVLVVVARLRAFADACAARKWRTRDFSSGHKQRFFLPRCKKKRTRVRANHRPFRSAAFGETSSQKCREERKKATTTTASARAECEARVGCRTRGGPAASSRVAGEGAPRESGGEPDRRGGGAVSRARSADFSNARRCRLAARDDRQRLLRCVRGGDAPERRRVHVGRARGCRGQPSVSGATSPPNATGRPSVLAPAGRVPSAKNALRPYLARAFSPVHRVLSRPFYFRIRSAARGTRT